MSDVSGVAKRLLLGRPVRSEHLGHTRLRKRIALPVFASDALSSVAYAPDEILLTLALAGGSAVLLAPWVGAAVALVMVVVVASYRQNVHAYPSGGGDYEVVSTNLGPRAGLTVASALLVDYVLTVAVSISSGAQYAASALPWLRGHETSFAVTLVVLLALANLRGVKEAGRVFAVPAYLFMATVGLTAVVGFLRYAGGSLPAAESADLEVVAAAGFENGLTGLGGALLVLRAFASGSAALTGVEAISNGVPAFRKPRSRNAATTLALLGATAVTFLLAILTLANLTGIKVVEDPHAQLVTADGGPLPADHVQHPALVQLAEVVFSGWGPMFLLVTTAAGLILLFAANTAFNGFPVLGSILARDGYLPRQMYTRGDRLAFSNGIVLLAGAAVVLIVAFDAEVSRLIQLYIVGVFISFPLSQAGMVRHWTRELRTEPAGPGRTRMVRSRVVNAVGFVMTGTVLVVVLVTKFTHGAWIALLAMALAYAGMVGIERHYRSVAAELALGDDPAATRALPSRVHALVLVSRVHRPTMRAVAYARATRPDTLEAVTVAVTGEDTERLVADWDAAGLPVPLRVLASPFREVTRPVVEYVRSIRRESPRDLVVLYLPEYVVGHWWERTLHNQSTARIRSRLRATPGVVVAFVPWQLQSSLTAGTAPADGTEPKDLAP